MSATILLLAGLAGPLAVFDDYTGRCWVAEVAERSVDRHCFRAVYDGQHVRDTHEVQRDGRTVYAGETVYSAEAGGIAFTYWNSLGGSGRGTAASGSAGTMTFDLTMRATATAKPARYRTVWRRTATGYDATTGGVTRHFRAAD